MNKKEIFKIVTKHYVARRLNISKLSIFEIAPNYFKIYNRFGLFQHEYSVNLIEKISHGGYIEVKNLIKKAGIARNLVRCREEICAELKVNLIVICATPSSNYFWKHMGYKKLKIWRNFSIKKRLKKLGLISYTMYKEI